ILNAILLFFVVLFPIFSLVGFGFDLAFGRGLISQDILILWVGLATSLVAIVFMLAMVASELKLISKNVGAYPALYPLGCIIFIIAILMASIKIAQDRGIEWKGASYKQAKVSRK